MALHHHTEEEKKKIRKKRMSEGTHGKPHKRLYKKAVKGASGKRLRVSKGGVKYRPEAQGTKGGLKLKSKTTKFVTLKPSASKFIDKPSTQVKGPEEVKSLKKRVGRERYKRIVSAPGTKVTTVRTMVPKKKKKVTVKRASRY